MTTNTRNQHGVKYGSDCYRTFGGARFDCWMSFPSQERIAAYRKASIRCRRLGDELFVHVLDIETATKLDRQLEQL